MRGTTHTDIYIIPIFGSHKYIIPEIAYNKRMNLLFLDFVDLRG